MECVALLGTGAYGTVTEVQTETGKHFALKRCDLFESDGSLVSPCLREIIFHQSMAEEPDHHKKGLCCALQTWTDNHHAFFLFPLFDCSLLQLAKQTAGKLKFDDFVLLALQLQNSISTLHEHGWMHRDIKPENVYVQQDGTLSLGDFSLVRFCDSSEAIVAQKAKGTSSSLVCTLWTRAPELVVAHMKGERVFQSSFETDAFSFGVTLLTLAAGRYVFGDMIRRVSSNCDHSEEFIFLEALFSIVGTDKFLEKEFPQVNHTDLPSFSAASARLSKFLPDKWSSTQQETVANVLMKLLDPWSHRRSSISVVSAWKARTSDVSESLKSCIAEIAKHRKAANHALVHTKEQDSLPVQPMLPNDTLWSMCGQMQIPVPLALHAVMCRRSSPLASTKALMFCLHLMHRFPVTSELNTNPEHVILMAKHVRMNLQLWKLGRQVESEPFLACCAAAWVFCKGTVPSKDDLVSDEMMKLIESLEVDKFFGSFGTRWKTQRQMLESWRRLNHKGTSCM